MQSLIDGAQCFATIRALRWPDGVLCPTCHSSEMIKQGRDDPEPERQRYLCKSWERRFDDVTDTIFAGHHQPLRVWILGLYCMGLNLSNHPMAEELALPPSAVHQRTGQLRQGMVVQKPPPTFSDEVAWDEVSSVAGHKGKPDAVGKKGGVDGVDGSRASADGAHSPRRSRRSSGGFSGVEPECSGGWQTSNKSRSSR